MKAWMLLACLITATPSVVNAASERHPFHHSSNQKYILSRKHEHIVRIRYMSLNAFLESKEANHNSIINYRKNREYKKGFSLTKLNEIIAKTYGSKNLTLISKLQSLPSSRRKQVACLALTIYHEDRGSSLADQKATAFVVLNRTKTEQGSIFGPTVCDVVSQRRFDSSPMQFSWMSQNPRALVPKEEDAWKKAQEVAYQVLNGKEKDITNGALYFWCPKHCRRQRWMSRGVSYKYIGSHIYMKTNEFVN